MADLRFLNVNMSGNIKGDLTVGRNLSVSGVIESTVPDGTAPFKIESKYKVLNLNVEFLDGHRAEDFAPSMHTHRYLSSDGGFLAGDLRMSGSSSLITGDESDPQCGEGGIHLKHSGVGLVFSSPEVINDNGIYGLISKRDDKGTLTIDGRSNLQEGIHLSGIAGSLPGAPCVNVSGLKWNETGESINTLNPGDRLMAWEDGHSGVSAYLQADGGFFTKGSICTGGIDDPNVDDGGICLKNRYGKGFVMRGTGVHHDFSYESGTDDTYFSMEQASDGQGGVRIAGYTENVHTIDFDGYAKYANSSSDSNAYGCMWFRMIKQKPADTGYEAFGSNENLMVINNYQNAKFIFKGNGDLLYDGSTTVFDKENDIMLSNTLRYLISGWDTNVLQKYKYKLENLGIIENGFISRKKLDALVLGTQGQLWNIIRHLAKDLGKSEEDLFAMASNYS